ncbi:MAG: GNAT family N-acetyltransferase [bacterium]|nr:GNAT family N-acetyltransferase [bacterium]MCP4801203.1 GNAT family N-acetyltransferase [bacterium]
MLNSDRLTLREFKDSDLEAVHSYGSDIEVVRYMEWGPNSRTDSEDFLARAKAELLKGPRAIYEFAVIETATDELIGGIGLHTKGFQAMLGYCYARPAWGKGFATEAAQLLVDYGFNTLGLHRIWAKCDTENIPSIRVLEKIGMIQEGCLKHDCQIRGEWRDNALFAILKEE